MMINPACYWVIARLPLGAGGVGESRNHSGGRGELELDELQTIRQHLTGCAACRQYEASMHLATEALAVAALNPPVPPNSRSLWLDLERRIAEHQELRLASTSTTRTRYLAAFVRVQEKIRGWATRSGDERWQGGWLGDEAREFLDFTIHGFRFGTRPRLALIVVSGLVAVVIAIRVGLPALHEHELASNAVVVANQSAPLERLGPPQSTLVESSEHLTSPADTDSPSDRQIAQVDPAPAREPEATSPTAARVESAPVVKAVTPPTRFNFDLDHGTPMPPDSRDPKPVY